MGITVLLGLLSQVFWLWMFIECLVKEPDDSNDKLLWGLIIFFGNLLGAILYFVVRRPERIERHGQ
jgi:hypothetical protein